MNKTLTAFVALLSLACISAFGSVPRQYMVDMKLSLDGKLVSSPRVVINEGKKAEISDQNTKDGTGTFMEVTVQRVPSEDDDQALLQMVVGRYVKGKKEILGSPQIMALENEEAAMEIGEGDNQLYKVSAKVSRVPAPKR